MTKDLFQMRSFPRLPAGRLSLVQDEPFGKKNTPRAQLNVMKKKDIRCFTAEELEKEIAGMGNPPHRARQIFLWINQKNVNSFELMTDIPKDLVTELKEKFMIGCLKCEEHLISVDGTEKVLWELPDGKYTETVLIKDRRRRTLCLSTQVGCRYRCPFCASGARGFKRDLTVSEITGQVSGIQKLTSERITNIVFMGMGEPLDNYDNLEKAIKIINSPDAYGIGARRITVSTCGVIPGIHRLRSLGLQIELSVSLHATDDDLRNELVPVNRKYPVHELISECKEYYKKTGRVITLEYTLIKGKNDSLKHADTLARVAKELKAKVNLISCSPFPGSTCIQSGRQTVRTFKERLCFKGVTATIRRSKGADILAACGQLAADKKVEPHRLK